MKNRRTLIVVFMLVATMCIGVGFAALSQTLTISGTANITKDAAQDEFNDDVYFSGTGAVTNCTAALAGDVSTKPDAATITIENSLGVVGDTATAVFTIKNEGNSTATVAVTGSDSTNFRVTADNPTNTIPAGGTLDVTVTVTLKTTVETDITGETFGLSLQVTSAT